jgi:hypothetical protein
MVIKVWFGLSSSKMSASRQGHRNEKGWIFMNNVKKRK